jgi:hypothetical protein
MVLRIPQRFDLGVGFAGAAMPAAADDFAALDQNGSDHGVGRGRAITAPGEAEGEANEISIGHLCAA